MEEVEYGVGLFKKLVEIDDFDELDDCIVVQTPSGGYHIYGEYFKELMISCRRLISVMMEDAFSLLMNIKLSSTPMMILKSTDHSYKASKSTSQRKRMLRIKCVILL